MGGELPTQGSPDEGRLTDDGRGLPHSDGGVWAVTDHDTLR